MDRVFFVSDMHFGHANIIKYCDRPFENTYFMDKAIVENWNKVVGVHDEVYVLGDVSFHKDPDKTAGILYQLNGVHYLLNGNHDWFKNKTRQVYENHFVWCKDYYELHIDHRKFVLCHFPFASWNNMSHGSINVHGHTHGNYKGKTGQFDAGVDCNGFTPVSAEQVVNAVKDGRDRLC